MKCLARFISVGRGHVSWEQTYEKFPQDDDLVRAIKTRKVLMSRGIEVIYTSEKDNVTFGSIHAGFHKVGTVEIITLGADGQRMIEEISHDAHGSG